MLTQRLSYLFFVLLCSSSFINAQTTLHKGDIILLAMNSDMGMCGSTPQSDQFSFVCFEDIEAGTIINITDNGWETQYPGFWGTGEGVLEMVRSGGTIPRGTVITVESVLSGGSWTYRTVSPDNQWTITDLNFPTGNFNINNGGEQIYFMQGGTWDNQGGNTNKGIYDGEVIFGANNLSTWAANGTVNNSNLHPDVAGGCYYNIISIGLTYMNSLEYAGPITEANHFEWLERIQSPQFWNVYGVCSEANLYPPNWAFGQSILIEDDNMGLLCPFACLVCPPADKMLTLILPDDGPYNVVLTNGIDTITLTNAMNLDYVTVYVTESTVWRIYSVQKPGGCTVYSHFYAEADINAPYTNPGVHSEIWICPTFGAYVLFNYLQGNPTPGGQWSPPLAGAGSFGQIYYSVWGEGTWTYYFTHGHDCPADTASVTVHFVDVDNTTIDVGCSQNGTPNYIFDDRTVITLNVDGDHFGAGYTITSSSGSISPNIGVSGVPTAFTLGVGTALGPNVTITIQGTTAPYCKFDFPITSPGFCSDPCDYEMSASVSGPEDICLKNCPDNPALLTVEVSGGTPPFTMDFELYSPGHPTWSFTNIPISAFQEIQVCIDSVPAPIYSGGYLTLPAYLGGSDITLTLLDVFDKYDCTSLLDQTEVFMNIHKLPIAMTTTLNLCRNEALHVDLTEYNDLINPFYDVFWYDGNPLAGGESISSPTAANLENVVTLWALVVDDYCENSVQIPFNIFPQPNLDSVPPISICLGGNVVLGDIPLNDANLSMATYTFHAGLPPDSTNILDTLIYLPEASTTIYVLASTVHMCYDTLPIDIIVEDYPGLVVEAQPCDVEAGTYSILFTSSAATIHASAGVVHNNATGLDSISSIPDGVDITIEVLNATGLCADTFLILAPVCNCPLINQPVPAAALYQLCEDEPLPLISVTIDPGFQANWYTDPSGGTPFLQNSLTFQPTEATSAIYYVESVDPSTLCYSIRTAITLDVFSLAILANLADPVICQFEPIDLSVFVPSVLNGIPGTGSWFDLLTGQPLSGVQHPKDGKGWYYLFTTTDGSCESRDTVVVTANPLPVINDYTIICNDEVFTYDIFFTTDADIVLADKGTLLQIPGTDSVSITGIPFGNDVQINLQYLATGCSSTNFQQAPDCSCPPLLISSSSSTCSDQGTVDLTDFQGSGADGSWQILSAPPGSNPATLSGSNFLGTNSDPGPYGLLMIRNVLIDNCADSANFELVLAGAPDAAFNLSQTTNTVSLEYPGIDYDSLHWSFGDGRIDNISNPTVVYSAIGQYLITLIVYNACGTDTSSVQVTVNTVSTNNPSINTSGWQIRPNPFKEILTIYGQPLVDGTATISLLDVHGKLISTENWIHASGQVLKEINVGHLPSCVILVSIQDEDSRVVLKAIHQR